MSVMYLVPVRVVAFKGGKRLSADILLPFTGFAPSLVVWCTKMMVTPNCLANRVLHNECAS